MSMKDTIKKMASEVREDVIRIRRHLHMHPELSYQEFKTAQFVADTLREMGIEPKEGVAGTGVTALITGNEPTSGVVALRADMDALPIQEANDVEYRSRNDGIMHACGHDVHTSSLLGTAMILNQIRDDFKGTVKLIFQPGEEKNPGGASLMIKDGVLDNPSPAKIFGQHVMPLLPVGKVGFKPGMYMASADEIYLTVHGKGGHGGGDTYMSEQLSAFMKGEANQPAAGIAEAVQASVPCYGIDQAMEENRVVDLQELWGPFGSLGPGK